MAAGCFLAYVSVKGLCPEGREGGCVVSHPQGLSPQAGTAKALRMGMLHVRSSVPNPESPNPEFSLFQNILSTDMTLQEENSIPDLM